MGSHLDSVPVGGNFDGLAAVVAGVVVQAACSRAGVRPGSPSRLSRTNSRTVAESSTLIGEFSQPRPQLDLRRSV